MTLLTEYEKQFVLGDIQVFREFDVTEFVNNACVGLGTKLDVFGATYNVEYYVKMLEGSIGTLQETYLDKVMVSHMNQMGIPNIGFQSNKLLDITVSEIRPQYLVQFAKNIGLVIDRVIKGSLGKNEFKHFVSEDMLLRVKKQMVKTSLPYYADPKTLVMQQQQDSVITVTSSYIKEVVYPFVLSFGARKKEMLLQYDLVQNALDEVEEIMTSYVNAINNVKGVLELKEKKIAKMNYLMYHATRALTSAVSYLSYMTIHKINLITTNIFNCKKILDVLIDNNKPGIAAESAFDTVLSMTPEDMGKDLLSERIDIFQTIANNLFEMNQDYILQSVNINPGESSYDLRASIRNDVKKFNYNTVVYNDIRTMYDEISESIRILGANSEDYLLVVDDMLEKSGLSTSLDTRFGRRVEVIDDISHYSNLKTPGLPGSNDTEMYLRVLNEVDQYAQNMFEIAKAARNAINMAEDLKKQFEENVNGEYENGESLAELKNYSGTLIEEIVAITNDVASKFMVRLRKLGNLLNRKANRPLIQKESEDVADLEIYDELIESSDELTDRVFELLTERYQLLKLEKDTGLKFVIEDGEQPAQGTTGTTNPAPAATTTTQTTPTQTTAANPSNTGNGKAKTKAIVDTLNKWMDTMVEKIDKLIMGSKAKQDSDYFVKNKENLLNKTYANVANRTPIVEYEHYMPTSKITNDIQTVIGRLSSATMTPQKLQGLADDKACANAVLPPGITTASGSNQPGKAITEYYLHGVNQVNPVVLRNAQLKEMVKEAVDYCEPYYKSFLPDIKEKVRAMKKNMEDILSKLTTESVDIIYGVLFSEDGEQPVQGTTGATTPAQTTGTPPAAGTAQPAANTVTSMSGKADMIKKWVGIYCNGVITACNVRYNAYMRLLHEIIADDVDTANNNQQQNPQPQQTPQQ